MVAYNPISQDEDHVWLIKVMNLGPNVNNPWEDPKLAEYLDHYKDGVITQANKYIDLRDTFKVLDMTETRFAYFVQGLHDLGFEITILDITKNPLEN